MAGGWAGGVTAGALLDGALGTEPGVDGGICRRTVEQAARLPTMLTHARTRHMGLILLEALAAGAVLVLIVWWTMFSGRDKGELKDRDREE